MSDIYKYAAKNRLRFSTARGMLTVEQLFDLPLKSTSEVDLDTVARTVNARLKAVGEESFVEDTSVDPERSRFTVALEVVKDVIATKQAEARTALNRTLKSAERKKILDVIAAKKDEKLSAASLDELEKKLAELDG